MHIAGKIFLGLGALMLLAGGVMTIMGGDSLEDVGDWDVEGKSEFNGPSGEWYHSAEDIMIIYVNDNVDCESFDVTYTDESGDTGWDSDGDGVEDTPYFEKEDCSWADDGADPSGYYSIGSFWGDEGTYDVDGTHGFYTVPMFEVLGEELGEAAGGFFAVLGGVGIFGCGICSLVLGGILALVLKDPQPPTQMQ